eukprot:TRINITY_DN2039_c0_g1_i1.p1 TRINITY_DN2039_c0_g1~~TRINITY_DN2039_c0_g1_i1.p1  ORF type:complete len:246 (-),score=19.94 TRINITY_DN2039_c0_g1_i1:32-769(-)
MNRPCVILFGDSITAKSFEVRNNGFGLSLCDYFACKFDVLNRGFSGYQTRWVLYLLERTFRKELSPALVIICWGANDATPQSSPLYVSLEEYTKNLKEQVTWIRNNYPGNKVEFILITPPAFYLDDWDKTLRSIGIVLPEHRSNENTQKYANAVVKVAEELGVKSIHLWNKMVEDETWHDYLADGLHLSKRGNELVWKLIKEVIEKQMPHLKSQELYYDYPHFSDIDRENEKDSILNSKKLRKAF